MIDQLAHQLAHQAEDPGGIHVQRGAEILAGPYPQSFEDFIGQDLACRRIHAAIESAISRDAPLDHILLASGTPGIGKTTLGRLIAAALGVGFVELGGAVTDKDAILALRAMEDKDVMFLDEVHRLIQGNSSRADWLLTLLQDGKIQTPRGGVVAPKITVIAATTEAQKLRETILDRFIKPVLVSYSTPEAVRIADYTARRLGFGVDPGTPMPEQRGWLTGVAKASDNNPRRMSDLISTVRDIALSTDLANASATEGYDLTQALEFSGLTPDGLTYGAVLYMLALYANDGTAGVATIKAIVNEANLDHTEKALITRGFINVSSRGRELTTSGMARARDLAKQTVATHVAREGAVA